MDDKITLDKEYITGLIQIILNKSHSDPIWTEGPRGIIAALIEQLIELECANCGNLWSILSSGIDTIQKALTYYHDKTVKDYLANSSDEQI